MQTLETPQHSCLRYGKPVRTGNWDLRVASLKDTAALLFAFNRPHYQKLIVQHLSDLLVMPKEILRHPSPIREVCGKHNSKTRTQCRHRRSTRDEI